MNKYIEKNNIPKNIRQIGHFTTKDKIYIEDYVMTYIKQLYKEPFDNKKLLVLVGENKIINNIEYIFINGVIEVDKKITKFKQLLENEHMSNVTVVKEDFFEERDMVGAGIICKNEWSDVDRDIIEYLSSGLVGDIVIAYDINEEEIVCKRKGEHLIRQRGYYVYYDRNEAMQNYMLCMKDGKSIEYGYTNTEIVDRTIDEKIRTVSIPKNTVYTSRNLDVNKYKNLLEKEYGKKIKYCTVVIAIIVLLLFGMLKVDKFENITQRKAKDLFNKTREVINKDEEGTLKIETIEIEETKTPKDNITAQPEKKEETKEDNISKSKTVEQEEINVIKKKSENRVDVISKNYYIVKKGDVLVDISRQVYGTIKKVESIKRLNGLKDEDKIFIGQRLLMP